MKYFLDTNTCLYFLKGKYPELIKKFKSKAPEDIKIPSIVVAELNYGMEKSNNKKRTKEIIENFLLPFEVIQFGFEESKIYGRVRGELESKGHLIGPNDLIMAVTVLSHNSKLVTNNEKEFKRVKSLKIENWI